MSNMQKLQLFVTPPHACSYIAERSSRMLFVDPNEKLNKSMLSSLSRQGFRRSGDFVYKPECNHCRKCLSVRIPVVDFKPNKSQKRAKKANEDIRLNVIKSTDATLVHYELFAKYICERHSDGDMYPPSMQQFEKFLIKSMADTVFVEFFLQNKLICVAVCDVLDDGLSAVYTFFDPDYDKRSLGTYSILEQIEQVKLLAKPYLYLGYWVPEAQKMKYKRNFAPQEIFINEQWHRQTRKFTDTDVEKLVYAINASTDNYIKLINLPISDIE